MTEYICGPSVTASNGEEALSEVTPVYKLAVEVATADSIVCIPRESIGIPLVVCIFLATMALFSIVGVIAGKADTRYWKRLKRFESDD